jgi:DNA replication protein DnaC
VTLEREPGPLRDDACPYGRCDGTGFVYDEASNTAFDCDCRPLRIGRARSRSLSGVIPRRYQGVSFDRPPVTDIDQRFVYVVRSYVTHLDKNLDDGRGLLFIGDVGTGKTTLAMLVSKAAMEADRTVAIYSLPRLLAMLRGTYNDDAAFSLNDLIDRLCAVDLLHVDDVGAEQTSPWVLEQLYTIVNTRYEDGRAVMLTTNLPDDELKLQIGDRTVSRLNEMCTVLLLHGDDQREGHGYRLPDPAPAQPAPGRWLSGADRAWEDADPDEPPAYGRPRAHRLD